MKRKLSYLHELNSKEQEEIINQIATIMIECSEMNEGEGDLVKFEKRITEFWDKAKVIAPNEYYDIDIYGENWDDYCQVDKSSLLETLLIHGENHSENSDDEESITEEHKQRF